MTRNSKKRKKDVSVSNTVVQQRHVTNDNVPLSIDVAQHMQSKRTNDGTK